MEMSTFISAQILLPLLPLDRCRGHLESSPDPLRHRNPLELFAVTLHGFPPAGGLDLHRDPGVPRSNAGVRPAQLHRLELAVRADEWVAGDRAAGG